MVEDIWEKFNIIVMRKNNPLRVLTVIMIIMSWSGNASKTNDLKQLYYFLMKKNKLPSVSQSVMQYALLCVSYNQENCFTSSPPPLLLQWSEVNCTVIFLFRQEGIHTAWKSLPPSEASLQFICKTGGDWWVTNDQHHFIQSPRTKYWLIWEL